VQTSERERSGSFLAATSCAEHDCVNLYTPIHSSPSAPFDLCITASAAAKLEFSSRQSPARVAQASGPRRTMSGSLKMLSEVRARTGVSNVPIATANKAGDPAIFAQRPCNAAGWCTCRACISSVQPGAMAGAQHAPQPCHGPLARQHPLESPAPCFMVRAACCCRNGPQSARFLAREQTSHWMTSRRRSQAWWVGPAGPGPAHASPCDASGPLPRAASPRVSSAGLQP